MTNEEAIVLAGPVRLVATAGGETREQRDPEPGVRRPGLHARKAEVLTGRYGGRRDQLCRAPMAESDRAEDVAFDDGRRLRPQGRRHPGARTRARSPARAFPPDALETFPGRLPGRHDRTRPRAHSRRRRLRRTTWWWGADQANTTPPFWSTAWTVGSPSPEPGRQDHGLAPTAGLDTSSPGRHSDLAHGARRRSTNRSASSTASRSPSSAARIRACATRIAINLVEPGEFILGYPDNRGNLPPGPANCRASDDPDNSACRSTATGRPELLPETAIVDAPREIGRNGSFLVIRQLEQDHDAFWSYCEGPGRAP